jgi:hypothetical protein
LIRSACAVRHDVIAAAAVVQREQLRGHLGLKRHRRHDGLVVFPGNIDSEFLASDENSK